MFQSQLLEENEMEELFWVDLVTEVLNGQTRNLDSSLCRDSIRRISSVTRCLNHNESSVITRRYTLGCANFPTNKGSSIAGIARAFGITKAEVRRLEASAIKRLREPDCFSYFVKNFGSKELLCRQISLVVEETSSLLILKVNQDIKFSEDDLSRILEAKECILEINKKYAVQPVKILPLTIEDLGLSARTLAILKKHKIATPSGIDGLCSFSEEHLLALNGVGPITVNEIKRRLAEHKLTLYLKFR